MDGILLTRLIKAIYLHDEDSLNKLVSTIIKSEKKKGHAKLAAKLQALMNDKKEPIKSLEKAIFEEAHLSELPRSQRNNQPLGTFIPFDPLRKHPLFSDEVEARFQRIEKEYVARDRLSKHNLYPRKKILLHGPPGCGKTMGAERLAWNLGLPLLKIRFDSVISSYFGESSSNLRSIFEASHKVSCVLLLDECDIIAKSRITNSDVGEIPRIVNMLLMLLDEYSSPGLLVATTNLEGTLDKAIYRRFDDIIEINKPTLKQINQLLKMTLSAINVSNDINWKEIANDINGFSAANVVLVAKNAAKLSILDLSEKLNQKHLEKAISEVKHP